MDGRKAISRRVSHLAKRESEVEITSEAASAAIVRVVRGRLLSPPSYAAGPYEVQDRLLPRRPSRLPFVVGQICPVAFTSRVEVAPVPS